MAHESISEAWDTINRQKGSINVFVVSLVLAITLALAAGRLIYTRLLKFPGFVKFKNRALAFLAIISGSMTGTAKSFGKFIIRSSIVTYALRQFALFFEEFISVLRGAASLACGVFFYSFLITEGKIITGLSVYFGLLIYEATFLTPRFINFLKNLRHRHNNRASAEGKVNTKADIPKIEKTQSYSKVQIKNIQKRPV